ncbi:hypothetical protein, partial [Streptococcus chenjunshii]
PDNRTKEQYELEQEFQPLFDFLAQEKKDFSEVNKYETAIIETDRKTGRDKKYSVDFDKLPSSQEGTYTITENGRKTEYPVSINDSGELSYSASVPAEYNEDLFNLHLKKDFFEKLPISDYTAEHPETYLKDISYEVDSSIPFLKQLMKKYNISQDANLSLYLENYYTQEMVYSIRIMIVDDNKILDLIYNITFKE